MPLGLQGMHGGGGDGVVEAAVPGMSQDYREVGHDNSEGGKTESSPRRCNSLTPARGAFSSRTPGERRLAGREKSDV